MTRTDHADILAELESIEDRDGIVTPEAVVEFARDPATALHSQFDWDDTEAAEKWRLHQARNVLNVAVKFIDDGGDRRPIRAFVSLMSDRKEGGYRSTVRVLTDADRYAELLAQAKAEADAWRKRYREFAELAKIRDAIAEVVGR